MFKKIMFYSLLAGMLIALSGCGGGESSAVAGNSKAADSGEKAENHDPVELTMYQYGPRITDDEFNQYIADPVNKKYPYITVQILHSDRNNTPDQMLAAGTFPDLVFSSSQSTMDVFTKLEVPIDLRDIVKQNKYNLDVFEPISLESIRSRGNNGEFYAIPFSLNFSALFYNKDIFDKFDVPYPKDAMTWDQAIDLSKRLTRSESGAHFTGLDIQSLRNLGTQLSLDYYDMKAGKAVITNDGWVNVLKTYTAMRQIPGFKSGGINTFITNQTLAMMDQPTIGVFGEIQKAIDQGVTLNWDLASTPTFPSKPGVGELLETHILMISNTSQHKDDAFKVIMAATEQANQLAMTKSGRLTAFKDKQMRDEYGKNFNLLNDKNIQGMFKNKFPEPIHQSEFDPIVTKWMNNAFKDVMAGTNVNSALREAEEAANQEIAVPKTGN